MGDVDLVVGVVDCIFGKIDGGECFVCFGEVFILCECGFECLVCCCEVVVYELCLIGGDLGFKMIVEDCCVLFEVGCCCVGVVCGE